VSAIILEKKAEKLSQNAHFDHKSIQQEEAKQAISIIKVVKSVVQYDLVFVV